MPQPPYFQNKIRRFPGWDYSNPGWYFVTIRVRRPFHGLAKVEKGIVHLSPIGAILDEEWRKTAEIRNGKVSIDQYVIMPDHLHGILIIGDADENIRSVDAPRRGASTGIECNRGASTGIECNRGASTGTECNRGASTGTECNRGASTGIESNRGASTGNCIRRCANKNWGPGSLGAMICQFKTKCTKRIRGEGFVDFTWQSRYYDRIIRSDKELARIRQYILQNPHRWEEESAIGP
jgi:putative transposase